ncbi:MAG: universal stress protein [Alphaproteobacteria bacterium]|nr:universal stress protein [Alphaproteobacteria bacterium]MCB9931218.1 universal stress protein [Alphaproteobacteria bacterium]
MPLSETSGMPSMVRCATLVGARFESFIEGAYIRAEPSVILASDDTGATTPALIESFEREDMARAERLQQQFLSACRDQGTGSQALVTEISGVGGGLGGYGRLFDLIVVGRPGREADSPPMTTLETALFDTGRVLLIAPPQAPASVGRNVVIAWNGSSETARTIALSKALLRHAEKVTVVTVDTGVVTGPDGGGIVTYLERSGIKAERDDVAAGSRGAGEAMLDEAQKLGADLLVKGGYTRSRLRQTIFGGPTSHILANAEIPVIMAH